MDNNDYLEQKAEIDAALAMLRKERLQLVREDDDDETLEALIRLQDSIENGIGYMQDFIPDIFAELITSITVYENSLTFRLPGGLELNENIGKEQEDSAT